MLSLAFITTLWIGQSAFLQDTTIPVTATEGHTGILGSTAYGLRCPSNLSGIGPDWRGIQIGLSTLDDLKALYEPYGQEPGILNEPPHSSDDPQEDYALTYYISIEGRDIQPELELPGLVEACIINNTIVALSVFAERDPSLPQTPIQLIALMGEPTLTSWDENDKETRMLHWPSDGISAQIYQGMSVWFLYLYPYQESDYLVHWPLSTALLQQPE